MLAARPISILSSEQHYWCKVVFPTMFGIFIPMTSLLPAGIVTKTTVHTVILHLGSSYWTHTSTSTTSTELSSTCGGVVCAAANSQEVGGCEESDWKFLIIFKTKINWKILGWDGITFISMIVIFVNRTIFAFYFIYGEGTGFGRRGGSCLSTSLPQDCL